MAEQFIKAAAVIRIQRNTDRSGYIGRTFFLKQIAFVDTVENILDNFVALFLVRTVIDEDNKIIILNAAENITALQTVFQQVRNITQDIITEAIACQTVNRMEIVNINHD